MGINNGKSILSPFFFFLAVLGREFAEPFPGFTPRPVGDQKKTFVKKLTGVTETVCGYGWD